MVRNCRQQSTVVGLGNEPAGSQKCSYCGYNCRGGRRWSRGYRQYSWEEGARYPGGSVEDREQGGHEGRAVAGRSGRQGCYRDVRAAAEQAEEMIKAAALSLLAVLTAFAQGQNTALTRGR